MKPFAPPPPPPQSTPSASFAFSSILRSVSGGSSTGDSSNSLHHHAGAASNYSDSESEKTSSHTPPNDARASPKVRDLKPLRQLPHKLSGGMTPSDDDSSSGGRPTTSAAGEALMSLFRPLSPDSGTTKRAADAASADASHKHRVDIDGDDEDFVYEQPRGPTSSFSISSQTWKSWLLQTVSETLPNKELSYSSVFRALVGSFLVSLINLVGSLAMASAVGQAISPGSASFSLSGVSTLVPLVMLCTNGLLTAGTYLVSSLNGAFPATSPTADAFLTPFYVKLALATRDAQRRTERLPNDPDEFVVFMATFTTCVSVGLALSGAMCVLATRVKIFNFGEYVPYPVICGLLSSIGCFLWLVSFSIDAGRDALSIFETGPKDAFVAIAHHIPSAATAFLVSRYGDKNVKLLPMALLALTAGSYVCIGMAGATLEEAARYGWFWDRGLFSYRREDCVVSFLAAPEPFHHIEAMFKTLFGEGRFINWQAVQDSVQIVLSMVFVYTLRMTLHVTAVVKSLNSTLGDDDIPRRTDPNKQLRAYGGAHVIAAFVGSVGTVPNSSSMALLQSFGLGSSSVAYVGFATMAILYAVDFVVVAAIPKCVFTTVLMVTAFKLLNLWLLKPFKSLSNKFEFAIIPTIAILAQNWGMLPSITLGSFLALLIFVRSIHDSGVVKYMCSGLQARSSVERPPAENEWLGRHGDLVQLLALSNFLFFGNATSIYKYIENLFEDFDNEDGVLDMDGKHLTPKPEYVIFDLSQVTGIDVNAGDVFFSIKSLAKTNSCRLIFCGVPAKVLKVLLGSNVSSSSTVTFAHDLESALSMAEDDMLDTYGKSKEMEVIRASKRIAIRNEIESELHFTSNGRVTGGASGPLHKDGFFHALQLIDHTHNTDTTALKKLVDFVKPIDLQPDMSVYETAESVLKGALPDFERGIFFVEYGLIKVEKDPNLVTVRVPSRGGGEQVVHRRTVAPAVNALRLARFGPGWLLGGRELASGLRNPGLYVAMTQARVFYLSKPDISRIEMTDPATALALYKLISYLMSKRMDTMIEQIARFHDVLSSRGAKNVSRLQQTLDQAT